MRLYAPDRLWRQDGAADRSADFEVERGLLVCLGGAAKVSAPAVLGDGVLGEGVLGEGVRDRWFYLVQSRIEGPPLEQVIEGLGHLGHKCDGAI